MLRSTSICIPCYNSERFIRTTIESALAQTVMPAEILVSDDNSPDRSYEIVKEYGNISPVRILRPERRLTLGQHYRFLLEQASGDYICFLSSDDALMPTFIEKMHAALGDDPDIGLLAAGCLDCNSKLIPTRVRGLGLPRTDFEPPDGFRHFAHGCGYLISVALMSRKRLLALKPLPSDADLVTDWYWALSLGAASKVKFLREPLGYYRFHSANSSHSAEDRWRRQAEAMLTFLQENVSPELQADLEGPIRRVRNALNGMSSPTAPSLMASLKNRVAKVMALRYRSLPSFILLAEKGIGEKLSLLQTSHHKIP